MDQGGNNFIVDYVFENKTTSAALGMFGLVGGIAAAAAADFTYLVYFDRIKKIIVFQNKKEILDYININYPSKAGLYEQMTNPKISEYIKLKSILGQLDLP